MLLALIQVDPPRRGDRQRGVGRDLSPEAIADLTDEAAELNKKADEATAKVKSMLETAGKTQAEADAELEADEGE